MTGSTTVATMTNPDSTNHASDNKPKKKLVSLSPQVLPVMKRAFANLCQNPSGVLYESLFLRVGVKHEYDASTCSGKMVLVFQTPPTLPRPLHHFAVQLMEPSVPPDLRITSQVGTPPTLIWDPLQTLATNGCTMAPHAQAKLTLQLTCTQPAPAEPPGVVKPFASTPTIRISFDTKNKESGQEELHQYPLLLPLVATAFFPKKSSSSSSSNQKATSHNSTKKAPPPLGNFLGSGSGSSSPDNRGGLGSASVAGSTPATQGGEVNIRADGGKSRQLLQKHRPQQQSYGAPRPHQNPLQQQQQSKEQGTTGTALKAHSTHVRSFAPSSETTAAVASSTNNSNEELIVLSSSTKNKMKMFESKSSDSSRNMGGKSYSSRKLAASVSPTSSTSSLPDEEEGKTDEATPARTEPADVSEMTVQQKRNFLLMQQQRYVASTSALPVSPKSRSKKYNGLSSTANHNVSPTAASSTRNKGRGVQSQRQLVVGPPSPLSPMSPTRQKAKLFEQKWQQQKEKQQQQNPKPQKQLPTVSLSSDDSDDEDKGPMKKTQAPKSYRRGLLQTSVDAEDTAETTATTKFAKSKFSKSAGVSVDPQHPPGRTTSASSTESNGSRLERLNDAPRLPERTKSGDSLPHMLDSQSSGDESTEDLAAAKKTKRRAKNRRPDRRSAMRKSLSQDDLYSSSNFKPRPKAMTAMALAAKATRTQPSIAVSSLARPTPSRRGLMHRSSSTRVMSRSSLDSSDEAPRKPASAPVSNKVPKVVKGLQSGCFMSADHVPKVLTDCLNVIHDDKQAQLDLGKSNAAIPSIVQMMHQYQDNAQVQQLACAILGDLCRSHKEIRGKCAEQGALQVVLVALLTHHVELAVQKAGLDALANLAMDRNNRNLIHESKGLEVLKSCMEGHVDDADVQLQSCRAIAALAELPLNARALAAMRMSKAVVQAMRNHADHEELQMHACRAIQALCEETDMNRSSLASAGAIEMVLTAMNRFEKCSGPGLQSAACFALWNMTINHSMNSDAIVAYYQGNNEGVRYILKALKSHQDDPAVQQAGCGIIKNLTEREENAKLVADVGAVVPILNAMRQHETDKAIQAEGCGALCNIAMVDEQKAPIFNAGGVGVMVVAMQQLSESAALQKQACRALKSLAMGDEQNQISIAAAGGIAAMLAAMDRHQENAAMQVLALSAIGEIAAIPRNRSTIMSNDGVRIIQQAMTNHPKEKVVEKTGWVILELLVEAVE